MAFHFPLKPILRLRHSLEERERLRLAMIINRINQLSRQGEQLAHERKQGGERIASNLATGMRAGELLLERSRLAAIDQTQKALAEHKAEVEQQRSGQEQALREAQRNRKTLENLRDHKFELYRLEQERRNQQRVDDLFGLRRVNSEQ